MEHLIKFCQESLHQKLDAEQIRQFEIYKKNILEWNKRFNLTSITDPTEIEVKHFIDSLTCLLVLDAKKSLNLIDIGTGAGFPGLPIKIVHPQIELTLIEATQKKADFCRNLVQEINLGKVEVLSGRAEDFAHLNKYREKFNVSVARAVAGMPTILEYLLPFVSLGGIAISMKGRNAQDEIDSARSAIKTLGGDFERTKNITLPFIHEERNLVVIKKVKLTPQEYPRRPGIPARKPLL